jgi:histidinol-phosphate aminotransferase
MFMQNRRDWLKSALTMSAGIPLSMGLTEKLMAAPMSKAEENFFKSKPALAAKIRLDSNENPYGPSDKAKQAIVNILSEGNRYIFSLVPLLKETLARHEGVTPDHIHIGAGSGELLCHAGAAFGLEGGRILSGFPTFPMLMTYAQVFKAAWDKVSLNEKLEYDYNAVASEIKEDTRLVFVCNPNNPTGTLVDPKIVRAFCEEASKKTTVYVDEAYLEFLEPSQQITMTDLVKQGANVIVSRTFSKIYGLAGIRLGYVIAKPELIKKMSKYQMGISVSQVSIAAATASLGDQAFMEMCRKKNADARKHLTDYLDKKGLFYGKSFTNFVFFDPQRGNAQQILTKLAERNIAIRVWDYNNKQWCRVSIGTLDEMKTFVKVFDEVNV